VVPPPELVPLPLPASPQSTLVLLVPTLSLPVTVSPPSVPLSLSCKHVLDFQKSWTVSQKIRDKRHDIISSSRQTFSYQLLYFFSVPNQMVEILGEPLRDKF